MCAVCLTHEERGRYCHKGQRPRAFHVDRGSGPTPVKQSAASHGARTASRLCRRPNHKRNLSAPPSSPASGVPVSTRKRSGEPKRSKPWDPNQRRSSHRARHPGSKLGRSAWAGRQEPELRRHPLPKPHAMTGSMQKRAVPWATEVVLNIVPTHGDASVATPTWLGLRPTGCRPSARGTAQVGHRNKQRQPSEAKLAPVHRELDNAWRRIPHAPRQSRPHKESQPRTRGGAKCMIDYGWLRVSALKT